MSYTKPFTAIFTWNNYDEYAFNLQQRIKAITGQCAVISSHKGSSKKDWHYLGEDAYYTSQWNYMLKLFKEHKSFNTLVQIQADSSCEDWRLLYSQIEKSYKIFNWGVYSPYVDWSGHYPPTEFVEHPYGYRSVKRTDCTVWAINELLLLQGVDQFDESINKYGWGIDQYYNTLSLKSGREIILDYNININHQKGSNYNHEEAIFQARNMADELFKKPFKISLCTSISNRIEDLQYTIPHNLKLIKSYNKPIEWVIVDYGSDNIHEVKLLIDSITKPDNLEIVYHRHNERWNIGRAKKLSHDLATGDMLINIDADNFIGIRYLEYIESVYLKNPLSLIHFKWNNKFVEYRSEIGLDLGFMGKIAISKGIYKATGGYPIDLNGYGGDDTDLINRIERLPINIVTLNDKMRYWSKTIPTIDEKTLEINCEDGIKNHEIINSKMALHDQLPIHLQHKALHIHTDIQDMDDECIHELYELITNSQQDITHAIHKWAQISGNKYKDLILSELYSLNDTIPKLKNIDEFEKWFITIYNIVNQKLHRVVIDLDDFILMYKPYSDHKYTQYSDDLIIVTSLSTNKNHLRSQPYCLNNWKQTGLKIYSVNTSQEIKHFKNIYKEVDEWIVNDDLSKIFNYPSQKINNLLDVATLTNKSIILINSDIEIHADRELISDSPVIGIRNNYNKYRKKFNIELEGLDIFILSPEVVKIVPREEFSIGRPFWDYWLAYVLNESEYNIETITDVFYHKDHAINWNHAECAIGFNHMINNYQVPDTIDWLDWRLNRGYSKWIKHD